MTDRPAEPTTEEECPFCFGRGEVEADTARGKRDVIGCPWCIEQALKEKISSLTAAKEAAETECADRAKRIDFYVTRLMAAEANIGKMREVAERLSARALSAEKQCEELRRALEQIVRSNYVYQAKEIAIDALAATAPKERKT